MRLTSGTFVCESRRELEQSLQQGQLNSVNPDEAFTFVLGAFPARFKNSLFEAP